MKILHLNLLLAFHRTFLEKVTLLNFPYQFFRRIFHDPKKRINNVPNFSRSKGRIKHMRTIRQKEKQHLQVRRCKIISTRLKFNNMTGRLIIIATKCESQKCKYDIDIIQCSYMFQIISVQNNMLWMYIRAVYFCSPGQGCIVEHIFHPFVKFWLKYMCFSWSSIQCLPCVWRNGWECLYE